MTLTEEESVKKWSEISAKLAEIGEIINKFPKENTEDEEFDKYKIARIHYVIAYTMTQLEKFKLSMSLTKLELDEHIISKEQERLEKYLKKIQKMEREESSASDGTDKRPFRIDSKASKRMVIHYTD